MHLKLIIDSKPLDIEVDDVIAGLLATRLNLPADIDHQEALVRYLGEKGEPWLLDEEHMRKRIFRRLILDVADPALVIRYLMADR
ncbi:hypothetical protein [Burkholderia sp. 22PA0106]|uniref:hypothetical protein n=1 Tax=Burkholderia sp. 22PA0106 TaxID=3237371 RepID=UPI0039C1F470